MPTTTQVRMALKRVIFLIISAFTAGIMFVFSIVCFLAVCFDRTKM